MENNLVINAENLILGRMASYAAKKALEGCTVDIVNAEKAIVTGTKEFIMRKLKERRHRTEPRYGPFFHKKEDRFVRRAIRGMLSYKHPRGLAAYKRIKCHIAIPLEFQDKQMQTFENMSLNKLTKLKYMDVKTICRLAGSKSFKMQEPGK